MTAAEQVLELSQSRCREMASSTQENTLIMSSSFLLYLIFLYLSLKIFRYICLLFLYIPDQSLDTFIELISFESAPESVPYSLKRLC